jgi:hypothetical protein
VSAGAVAACSCFAQAEASNNAVTLKNKALRFIDSPHGFPQGFGCVSRSLAIPPGRMGLTRVGAPRSDVANRCRTSRAESARTAGSISRACPTKSCSAAFCYPVRYPRSRRDRRGKRV